LATFIQEGVELLLRRDSASLKQSYLNDCVIVAAVRRKPKVLGGKSKKPMHSLFNGIIEPLDNTPVNYV
jgi:hypothetical protein